MKLYCACVQQKFEFAKSAHRPCNMLRKEFKTELINDIAKTKHFSMIIESQRSAQQKIIGISHQLLLTKQENVVARFLNLLLVPKGKAEHLFVVLRNEIEKHKLSLTELIGFSADTTNVMFGCNNSIVSRLKDANLSCIVLRCLYHSITLKVH